MLAHLFVFICLFIGTVLHSVAFYFKKRSCYKELKFLFLVCSTSVVFLHGHVDKLSIISFLNLSF